jgi:WD40 repeat protein
MTLSGPRLALFAMLCPALLGAPFSAPLQEPAEEAAAAPEVFAEHEGAVTSVAFLDKGKRVVTSTDKGELKLWTERGKQVGEYSWSDAIEHVCVADDGRTLSFLAGRAMGLVEGKKAGFRGNIQLDDRARCATWVPRWRWTFVGFDNGKLERYESGSADDSHDTYRTGAGSFDCLAAGPEGERMAAGTETGEMVLIDPRELEVTATWQPDDVAVVDLCFSADGELLAAGDAEGAVRIFDPSVPKEVQVIEHGAAVTAVAFGPKGRVFLSADGEGTVRIWSVKSGEQVAWLAAAEPGRLADLTVAPKGNAVLAAGPGKVVTRWDVDLRKLAGK